MATPEAEGSEPVDFSPDSSAQPPGHGDLQTSGPFGSSSSSAFTSGDASGAVPDPLGTPSSTAPCDVPQGNAVDAPVSDGAAVDGMDDFLRLQRRLLTITLCLAAGAVPITALVFDRSAAFSLAIGAMGALLYLRLLARSVSRLGENSRSVGKVQLLVPIVLVLAASRLPQLSILPVFLGFLLYKPAVIIQALTDA